MESLQDKRKELETFMKTLWFVRNYDASNLSESEVEKRLAIARKGRDKASISREDFNYLLDIKDDSGIWD